jgi:hypothetical protein
MIHPAHTTALRGGPNAGAAREAFVETPTTFSFIDPCGSVRVVAEIIRQLKIFLQHLDACLGGGFHGIR